ncbi:MAG TPA: hypothetical protein VKB46_13535 [Pyrinomonadaceae bacterium]|nr:hypothetical protein [Pyrinomonadaceae bacterium]
MPIWAYSMPPLLLAVIMIVLIDLISLAGLFITRRFLLPHFHYHDGVNDAVSGTVQAIGVFYGITVGLIAVGVWNTYSNAGDLVSREASAIGALYNDVGGYPSPLREELRQDLRNYTVFLIDVAWPEQRHGQSSSFAGAKILEEFQNKLYNFEPATPGKVAIHQEALSAYNKLLEYRRLRIDAVGGALSGLMWSVIWVGAVISIGVAYLYRIEDVKLHSLLILLMSGFLAIVLFMIVVNDKPFYGAVSVSSDPYKLILDRVINVSH